MKKLASFFSTIVVLCAILTVCASARASDQIDGGWAAAQAASKGQVAVEFQVNGTGKMSKIGANLIILYEKSTSGWIPVERITSSDVSSLFTTSAYSYCNTQYFNGTLGKQYYAKVTVFATDSTGTDYKTYTTNTIVAKR